MYISIYMCLAADLHRNVHHMCSVDNSTDVWSKEVSVVGILADVQVAVLVAVTVSAQHGAVHAHRVPGIQILFVILENSPHNKQ